MKISEQWLRDFVSTDLSREGISELLTLAGLEVDGVLPVSSLNLEDVVVSKILQLEDHNLSENLKVCIVDIGIGSPKTVVCGAPDVTVDALVAYVPVGAKLGTTEITEREIKGIVSEGMLCSREDLGLEEKSEGLLKIPDGGAVIGEPLSKALGLPDFIFDLDLTPNRGDCFSALGICREIGALTGMALKNSQFDFASVDIEDDFPIILDAPQSCPIYAGRIIRDINNKGDSPVWISERLRRSGVRPVNPIVDITNYVMLELGQPMHAFDYDQLKERIVVRQSKKGEKLKLLDGQSIELDQDTLVIADKNRPIALAGVMGGLSTGVSEETANVFLESAFFDPVRLAGVARKYGLQTEASIRFERGVDPELQKIAIERATVLIKEICGGVVGKLLIAEKRGLLKKEHPVLFRPNKVNQRLGTNISADEMLSILKSLYFEVEKTDQDNWKVGVPTFRFDIEMEVDLIEEIARISGYEKIPIILPKLSAIPKIYPEGPKRNDRLRQAFVWRSYTEAVTYSFVSKNKAQLFGDGVLVELLNPISAEMTTMRPNIWCSLIDALLHNANRQRNDLRLFEIGKVFEKDGEKVKEESHVSALRYGVSSEKQWDQDSRSVDFFDLKYDLELIAGSLTDGPLDFIPNKINGLHPSQSADIYSDGSHIGVMGAIHPTTGRHLGLSGSIFLFELNLDVIKPQKTAKYEPVSKFPSVSRDLSIVVNEEISAQQCLSSIKKLEIAILQDLQLFDLYRGQGIDSKKKSFSLGLIFQSPWSTLTDDEVDAALDNVLAALQEEVGAALRN